MIIVKLSSLGDIVQSLPVLAYLKKQGHHVTWVVDLQFKDLVSIADQVIALPIRAWKEKRPTLAALKAETKKLRSEHYDVAFDLQGNCKAALVMALIKAHDKVGFGRQTIAEWPALFASHFHFEPEPGNNIRSDYLTLAQNYFQDQEPFAPDPIFLGPPAAPLFTTSHKKVALAAGAQWSNKELKWETLQALVQRLDQTLPIEWLFTSGSPREQGYADKLAQMVKTAHRLHLAPLPTLQRALASADALIAVDSLPLHLAALTDLPTFSLFGPSLAAKYAPTSGHSVQGPCPYGQTFLKRCPRLRSCPTSACIKELPVDDLYNKLLSFLTH